MDELREKLAERFACKLREGWAWDKPWMPDSGAGYMYQCRLLADECLRQMHWAASEAAHSYRSSEGYDDRDDAEKDALDYVTLAPDDWRP